MSGVLDSGSLAFVTTLTPAGFPLFGVRVDPSHPDWGQTRLKLPLAIRTDRLCTLNTSVISGRVGVLSPRLMEEVRRQLKTLFGL